jgi:hypothetical protein
MSAVAVAGPGEPKLVHSAATGGKTVTGAVRVCARPCVRWHYRAIAAGRRSSYRPGQEISSRRRADGRRLCAWENGPAVDTAPPEPGPGAQQGRGMTPEQIAYPGGRADLSGRPAARRMSTRRIIVGITWAVIALILGAGGFAELSAGITGGAILCFVLAAGTGWYDYRVWTFKARRLWFIV